MSPSLTRAWPSTIRVRPQCRQEFTASKASPACRHVQPASSRVGPFATACDSSLGTKLLLVVYVNSGKKPPNCCRGEGGCNLPAPEYTTPHSFVAQESCQYSSAIMRLIVLAAHITPPIQEAAKHCRRRPHTRLQRHGVPSDIARLAAAVNLPVASSPLTCCLSVE